MKSLIRNFLIHISAIWATSAIIPGFTYSGGTKTLILAAVTLMLINLAIIPLIKIMFLPLNLLTLGFFTWVVNVIGVYILTIIVPQVKLMPYTFSGLNLGGVVIPGMTFNVLMVAVLASFLIGFTSHFLQWLYK